MLIIVTVVVIYLIIGVTEIPPLYMNKQKKELTVYCMFFSIAFAISLLLSLGVEIPNPIEGIKFIIESLGLEG